MSEAIDTVSKSSDSLAKTEGREMSGQGEGAIENHSQNGQWGGFDGVELTVDDERRLSGKLAAVRHALRGGHWWTLASLALYARCGEAGVSARLRDLRKARFGGHVIERRRVSGGVWEYRMVRP